MVEYFYLSLGIKVKMDVEWEEFFFFIENIIIRFWDFFEFKFSFIGMGYYLMFMRKIVGKGDMREYGLVSWVFIDFRWDIFVLGNIGF